MNRDDFNELREIPWMHRNRFILKDWKLELLGRGGSRAVYALDETRVLKVATAENLWGERQMQREVEIFTSPEAPAWLSAIYDYDDVSFTWAVHERAVVDEVDDSIVIKIIQKMNVHPHRLFYSRDPFALEVQTFCRKFCVSFTDTECTRHWGLTVRTGSVCLVDYGY